MKKRFSAVSTQQIELDTEQPEVPEPLQNPSATPQPLMRRLMPLFMVGMMILMMYVMTQIGGRNPAAMMMMPMMMMPMMMMGMMGGNKNDSASLNDEREDYRRQLDEIRKVVWKKGEILHKLLQQMFPSFELMTSGIGNPNVLAPMWTVDESTGGGYTEASETDEINYTPYLSPRVGTGVIKIVPAIIPPDVQIEEKIEGVSGWFLKNFMRIVPYVVNAPLGISLDRERQLSRSAGVSIGGEEGARLGLVRSMVCSLAYNHSPDTLRLAVISNRADDWEWMKWLPHAGHPAEADAAGPSRMIYDSFSEFTDAMNLVDFATESAPYFIVVVDCPDATVKNAMPSVKRMSYIVASAGEDYIATDKANRYVINKKGALTLKGTSMEIHADNINQIQAEWFARRMSGYGTGLNTIDMGIDEWTHEESEVVIPPWNEVVGVHDIDTFDPRSLWQESLLDMNLELPVGYPVDETTQLPLDGNPVFMDIADSASGGTGPHGLIAGTTGTGKSYSTKSILLAGAAKYSPEKLSFICIDYKGGATFFGFEKLPHTIAIITNLENEKDLLHRSLAMLEGILQKRQAFYQRYKVADLAEYRKRLRNGELPEDAKPVPDILVVFDEFVEFITNNPTFKKNIETIARIGRTLGVHLLLVSQDLDQGTVGDAMAQMNYGIALRLKTAQGSRAIIQSDRATDLPSGKGDGYLYKSAPTATLTRFRGYDLSEPYSKTTAVSTVIENDVDYGDIVGSVIAKFDRHRAAGAAVKISSSVDEWESLMFKEDYEQQQREKKAAAEKERKDGTRATVYEAVLEAIARWNGPEYPHAPQLWTQPLKIPITYRNSDFAPRMETNGLYLNIGEIDDPYHHQKLPFYLNLSDSDSQTFIAGASGSGLTTALASVVSSSNMGCPPGFVQTILMDFAGASLYNLKDAANVIGACTANEGDRIKRYMGEVFRILQYREQVIGENRLSGFEDYLAKRTPEIYQSDPYGHIVIVIDDFNRAADIAAEETDSMSGAKPAWWLYLSSLSSRGRAAGIHLVASVPQDPMYTALKGFRSYRTLHLRHGVTFAQLDSSLATMDPMAKSAFKAAAKDIPRDQPGRFVDSTSGLSGRIRIPVDITPEPYDYDESGAGIYRQDIDYTEEIHELNVAARDKILASGATLPPAISTVDESIAMPILLLQFTNMVNASAYEPLPSPRDIRLPYGHSITAIDPLFLKTGDALLAFGEKESGKKNLIRDFIYSLYALGNPDTAKVVMLDANGELYEEAQLLKQREMLAGYADNLGESKAVIDGIQKLITERTKNATKLQLTQKQKHERSWYAENNGVPYDIYIIVNGLQMFGVSTGGYGPGPIHPIIEALQTAGRSDLGITFIGVGTDQSAETVMSGPVYAGLNATGADVHCIRMSGIASSNVKNVGKFTKLPPGRGYRFLNGSLTEFQAAYIDPQVMLGTQEENQQE